MTDPHTDHLPSYRIRPRFQVESELSVSDLTNKIRRGLEDETSIKARIIEGFITLYFPSEEQHFWSPQLSLNMYESENGTLLRGIYGPRPAVWTMFVFFYSIIGFAILIIAIFGFSNLSLGNNAHILWLIPVLIVLFLSLFLTSYFGQRLSHNEMIRLHHFVEKSTGMVINP